jgi:hypothetical protein
MRDGDTFLRATKTFWTVYFAPTNCRGAGERV